MQAFGIDIGGTGIKGAPVDLATGNLVAARNKIATPQPATPDAVAEVVRQVAQSFNWTGVAGATFPGVVTSGTVRTAANVDKAWIDTDAAALFSKALGAEGDGAQRRRRGGDRGDDLRGRRRRARGPC